MYAFLSDSSKQANILVDSGKVFPRVGICWSKTVALQYARPGCQDHDHDHHRHNQHHHHHHHLVAQPVDDVEGVEEALRRLWVKEGSKVTVGISGLAGGAAA